MIRGYSTLKPFRFWCQKVLPLVYDDSLSYYELLNKVVNYLNNTREDLQYFITNWSTPEVVTDYNDFLNTDKIYLYMGDQAGYNPKHWYFYNPNTHRWQDGGEYALANINDDLIYVTPQMYGAVADGFTDDSYAIASAIEDGRILVFPKGDYYVESVVSLRSNLDVLGIDATLKFGEIEDNWLIDGNNLSNINVTGLKFDFGEQTTLKHAMTLIGCSHLNFSDCEFTNGYGYAIRLNNSSDVLFDNCYFHNITGASGNPGGGIYGQDMINIEVKNCYASHIGDHFVYALGQNDSHYINVHDNTCEYCGENNLTSGAAIVAYGRIYNSSINNNKISHSKTGIQVSNYGGVSGTPHEIVMESNALYSITENGISVIGLSDARCENISISGLTAKSIGQDAILVRYTDRSTIVACAFDNITRYGINLDYANENIISACTIHNIGDTGIILGSSGSCDKNIVIGVTGNNSNGAGTGIYFRTGDSNKLCACTITGFLYNISNRTTNSIIINKTPSDGSWAKYCERQLLTGTTINYTAIQDAYVTLVHTPTDLTLTPFIKVRDDTISEDIAMSYGVAGNSGLLSVSFPLKTGHTYTFTQQNTSHSLAFYLSSLMG